MRKKIISIALCLCMVLTLLPTTALAMEYNGWDSNQTYSDGDTITIGGTNYTYKGDISTSYFQMIVGYAENKYDAMTGDLVWKAGDGYVLYSNAEKTGPATVTLHDATCSGYIILPCNREEGLNDPATPCDTTVTLEGESTLSGTLFHYAGATIFTGSGNLRMTAHQVCSLSGDVTVTGGATVTLGDGQNASIAGSKMADIYGLLTVDDGGTLTVTTNTVLCSGSISNPTAYPGGITVDSDGTLENNGIITMNARTAADPGITGDITGSGVVKVGDNELTKLGDEWVVYGGDKSSRLDLTTSPTVKTTYMAGEGTIVFTPAESGGNPTLTLNNATVAGYVTLKGEYTLKLEGTNNAMSFFANQSNGFGTGGLIIDAAEGASLSADYMATDYITGDKSALNTIISTFTATAVDSSGDKESTFYGTNLANNGSIASKYINIDAGATVTVDGDNVAFEPAQTSEPCNLTNNGKIIINFEKTLDLSECTAIANDGTIENNGTLILPDSTTGNQIKALNLTGNGVVKAGTKTYLNDGTEVSFVNGDLDFSNTNTPLTGDGYVLDENTKTLTLTDVVVEGDITLPDENYTIVIDGNAKAQVITFNDSANNNDLTISGGTLDCSSVGLQGDLTIDGVTMTGGVSNTNVGNNGLLTIKNSTWNSSQFSWMTNDGIVLDNSTLTIPAGDGNQFWTEKIVMDDDSVIDMGCPLNNYNNVSDGMSGIEKYLPTGYSLGIYNSNNTILDPEEFIASGIVIKKQTTPGGSGGGTTSYTLTFETNGGSAIANVTKAYGTTVDLATYQPTMTDYDFDGWYSDSNLTTKVTSIKLTQNTTVYAKWTAKTVIPFEDVPEDAYYKDAVIWATDNDITEGTSATTFSPDGICTRAQAVTFLWRASGSPAPKTTAMPFNDVPTSSYFHNAVLWAVEQGIIKGTSETTFSPDMNCSRAHIVTILWRMEGSKVATVSNPFVDVSDTAYYADAVLWAVDEEITVGTSTTTFSPDDNCTRAQIVTFIYRDMK